MKATIFYSWQSDSPSHIGRDFIEEAARGALARIAATKQFNFEPVLDRDAQGRSGSPEVAESIFRKIDDCAIFLADVTIISRPKATRPTPNPDVLIELGYAVAKLGWERVICVMNKESGKPGKLPFDIQHRRWPVLYSLASNAKVKKANNEKTRLSDSIELALRTVIESGVFATSINPKDRRVALELARALAEFRSTLAHFLSENGLENGARVFQNNYDHDSGTANSDYSLLDPIVKTLAEADVLTPSNMNVGDKKLSWAGAFNHDLRNMAIRCNTILDRYADRDERLVELAHEVGDRARMVAFMIEAALTHRALIGIYDHGVPQAHLDWYRALLVSMLKAYRLTREYGVQ